MSAARFESILDQAKTARSGKKGKVVLAPPGTGKSTFIKKHPDAGWVEGDDFYDPIPQEGVNEEFFQKADKVNTQLKRRGKKVMTSTWWSLKDVDAIVIPELSTLQEHLKGEERPGNEAAESIRIIKERVKAEKFPKDRIYKTLEEATDAVSGP